MDNPGKFVCPICREELTDEEEFIRHFEKCKRKEMKKRREATMKDNPLTLYNVDLYNSRGKRVRALHSFRTFKEALTKAYETIFSYESPLTTDFHIMESAGIDEPWKLVWVGRQRDIENRKNLLTEIAEILEKYPSGIRRNPRDIHIDIASHNPDLFPSGKIPKKVLDWVHSLAPGSIMSPQTFQEIERDAYRRYRSHDRARRAAGKAYWKTAIAKYKETHSMNNPPKKKFVVIDWAKITPVSIYPRYTAIVDSPDIEEKWRASWKFNSYEEAQKLADELNKEIEISGKTIHRNPPSGMTEIYRNIIAIFAEKPDGRKYKHEFKPGSQIFGLPDGSILVRNRKGKRLWKNF